MVVRMSDLSSKKGLKTATNPNHNLTPIKTRDYCFKGQSTENNKISVLTILAQRISRGLVREVLKRRLRVPHVNDDWKLRDRKNFFGWINLLAMMGFDDRWNNRRAELLHLQY